jgi:hypothetical protein
MAHPRKELISTHEERGAKAPKRPMPSSFLHLYSVAFELKESSQSQNVSLVIPTHRWCITAATLIK